MTRTGAASNSEKGRLLGPRRGVISGVYSMNEYIETLVHALTIEAWRFLLTTVLPAWWHSRRR